MKKIVTPAAAVLGVVVAPLVTAATALAGPRAEPDSLIDDLRSNGYRVIITKVGSDHPSQCTVQGVTQQPAIESVQPGRNRRNQPTMILPTGQKVAYVTLAC